MATMLTFLCPRRSSELTRGQGPSTHSSGLSREEVPRVSG